MSRATFHPPRGHVSIPGRLEPATPPADRPGRSGRPRTAVPYRAWRPAQVRLLVVGDTACALPAAAAGLALHLGPGRVLSAAVLVIAAVSAAGWVLALCLARCYDRSLLGEGVEEFRRVVLTALSVLGCAAVVVWVGRYDVPAAAVAASLSLMTALTLAQRYGQRRLLRRARIHGRYRRTTLLVGPGPGVAALHTQLGREAGSGFDVVGCCLSGTTGPGQVFAGLPVLGRPGDVVDVVRRFGVDTVAVLPSPELDGAALQRLGWELTTSGTDVLLAPMGTETAGRVRTRWVCGLLLLDVGRPDVRGPRRLVKTAFDWIGAALGLVVLLPVLLGIAVAVKTTSPGPVLVRQQRVGRDGALFPVLRFRTAELDDERPIAQLTRLDDGTGMLVGKLQEPRVTRVGRALRRHSLDELPQLLNVLRGEMSLVGPRPILPTEIRRFDDELRRRCAVKPGLTGLWQIGGRSGLSWEESARLDVQYVENWSLRLDLSILLRTAGAVIRAEGAS